MTGDATDFFQFHTGSIRSRLGAPDLQFFDAFNSTLVRLEEVTAGSDTKRFLPLSIPHWFD